MQQVKELSLEKNNEFYLQVRAERERGFGMGNVDFQIFYSEMLKQRHD